ncbi:MAG: cupin domain-containing protein [Acidobacteriota bacterium]
MKYFKKLLMTVFALFFLLAFGNAQNNSSGLRLTPQEIEAIAPNEAGAGTSGVSGIKTRILKGDPTKDGLYTIQLTVPANTKIQAHTHPDDRVATVVSGIWQIGYGSRFDEKKLKALAPGSFYTEQPNVAHFARTGKTPVVVQITGYGPTGTEYVDLKENK